jgi:hypothetical protein
VTSTEIPTVSAVDARVISPPPPVAVTAPSWTVAPVESNARNHPAVAAAPPAPGVGRGRDAGDGGTESGIRQDDRREEGPGRGGVRGRRLGAGADLDVSRTGAGVETVDGGVRECVHDGSGEASCHV